MRGVTYMICALIQRLKSGWKIDAEYMGYGNKDIVEAFMIEGIDLQKEIEKMQIGDVRVWNIGWYPNDVCHRKFLPEKII